MTSNEGLIRWQSIKTEECIEFKFNWTIHNFLEVIKVSDHTDRPSPNFGGPTKFGAVPCDVTAYVDPEGDDDEDYLCPYLSVGLYGPHDSMSQHQVSILGADGQKLNTKTNALTVFDFAEADSLIPLKEIEKQKDLYLPNGNLTLRYEGKVWLSLEENVRVKYPDCEVPTMITKHFFESGNNSDITIKAGSQEFKCHKSVLSIRSEYFRAMFESGMKESQEGIVDFSEQMDGDVLKDLLEYLYLGMASNLERTCQKMLEIASMFLLDDLKFQSEEALIGQMCPDNALDIAVFARDHGAKKLYKKAICFLYKSL